MVSTRMH